MSTIKSENWDGVTAPAIPSGWTVDTELTTGTATSPTSSPNSLVYDPAHLNAAVAPNATWGTPDTNRGDVQVSATVRFANSGSGAGEQDVWVDARANALAPSSDYAAGIQRNAGANTGFFLQKAVSGSATTLGRVGATAFADATNYRIFLSCLGTTIRARCQRLSDSFWLTSSGTWVSDASNNTWAIAVTDSSVSGAGYAGAGFYLANGLGGAVGLDDWLLETAAGTTYYVAASGSDSNAGTDAAHPWQTIAKVNGITLWPGDAVLFNGGDTFSGNLLLTASGTVTNPLAVSSYGSGVATISCGNSYGVQVKDADYVHISNLVITGSGVTLSSPTTTSTTSTAAGIYLLTTTTQASIGTWRIGHRVDNVTVSGCYHGIQCWASAGSATGPYPVGFSDLQITNCTCHDCAFLGIALTANPNNPTGDTPYSKYIYIADCVSYNIYGDSANTTSWTGTGILLAGTTHGLIERCLVYNCGQANHGPSEGPSGIWFFEATYCTIQFCEVHHMHDDVGADGTAFDFDGGSQNCLVQYCYSHDNDGTAVVSGSFTGSNPTQNNTYRYNISQNDGRTVAAASYRDFGTTTGMLLHNNTFYCGTPGTSPHMIEGGSATYYNNIFYVGSGVSLLSSVSAGTFAGNLYYFVAGGFSVTYNAVTYSSLAAFQAVQEKVNGVPTGLAADPQLSAPGSGGTLLPTQQVAKLSAYALGAASPARDAGLDLRALFAIDPGPLDFSAHPVRYGSSYDVGACEYGAAALVGGGLRRVNLAGGIGG